MDVKWMNKWMNETPHVPDKTSLKINETRQPGAAVCYGCSKLAACSKLPACFTAIIVNSFTAWNLHRLKKKKSQQKNKNLRQTLTNLSRTWGLACVCHFHKLSRAAHTLSYVRLQYAGTDCLRLRDCETVEGFRHRLKTYLYKQWRTRGLFCFLFLFFLIVFLLFLLSLFSLSAASMLL
jgi:hypothetical protein